MNATPTPLLSVGDVAALIGKTEAAVYAMVHRLQIPHIKLGRAVRFEPAAIDSWLKSKRVRTSSRAA